MMFSDTTWNRINAVTGTIGMVLAAALLAVLLVLGSPVYALGWLRRRVGWGWRPRTG